jgi:hypothetical protein
MTIATDQDGNILGAIQHADAKQPEGMKTAVAFAPGARLHTVDVKPEIDMTKVSDVAKLHDALGRHARSAK